MKKKHTYIYKKKGISLMMTFGITFVVMMFAFFLLTAILDTMNRTANIERSNQIFYASESGIEAGIFHATIRGMGTHFCDNSSDPYTCDWDSVDPSQTIQMENGITTEWTLLGRTKGKYGIAGILKEGQSLSIPLSWNDATNPKEKGNRAEITDQNISVLFFKGIEEASSTYKKEFPFVGYSVSDIKTPDNFQFGDGTPQVMVGWQIIQDDGVFLPYTPQNSKSNPCAGVGHTYMCTDSILTGNRTLQLSQNAKRGFIMPDTNTPKKLSDFYKLSQNPVLQFSAIAPHTDAVNETNIVGIPYFINRANNEGLPLQNFKISTRVIGDGFEKEMSVTIPHRRNSDHMGYVLFD